MLSIEREQPRRLLVYEAKYKAGVVVVEALSYLSVEITATSGLVRTRLEQAIESRERGRKKRERERHTHTHTHTHREKERERERERDSWAHTHCYVKGSPPCLSNTQTSISESLLVFTQLLSASSYPSDDERSFFMSSFRMFAKRLTSLACTTISAPSFIHFVWYSMALSKE